MIEVVRGVVEPLLHVVCVELYMRDREYPKVVHLFYGLTGDEAVHEAMIHIQSDPILRSAYEEGSEAPGKPRCVIARWTESIRDRKF